MLCGSRFPLVHFVIFDRALPAQLVKQFAINITRYRVGHHGQLPGRRVKYPCSQLEAIL